MKTLVNILLSAMLLFSGGCATQSLLPTQGIYTESTLETYNQVESVVNKIKIGKTKYSDLVKMGPIWKKYQM